MSSFEQLKADIRETLISIGNVAVHTAGGCDSARQARETFARVTPQASNRPEAGELAAGIAQLEGMVWQVHDKAMELYYQCETVEGLFK